jgi:hypothetical protein
LKRAAKGKKDFWRPYEDIDHNNQPRHPAGTTLEGREANKGGFEHDGPGLAPSRDARDGSSSEDGGKVIA